jgi:hypothetical protein
MLDLHSFYLIRYVNGKWLTFRDGQKSKDANIIMVGMLNIIVDIFI